MTKSRAIPMAFLASLLLLGCPTAIAGGRPTPALRGGNGQQASLSLRALKSNPDNDAVASILCHVMEVRTEYLTADSQQSNTTTHVEINDDDPELVCETTLPSDDNQTAMWMYQMDNLPHGIRQELILDSSDHSWLQISQVRRNDSTATITILPDATITVVPAPEDVISLGDATSSSNPSQQHQRQLTPTYQSQGSNTVLVVRVTYLDHEPDVSADDLRGHIFGIGPNAQREVNLRRQIKSCSFGKLLLQPAPQIQPQDRSEDSSPVVQGVAELHVTEKMGSTSVRVLENMVATKIRSWYGSKYILSEVDHIILVMPDEPDLIQNRGRNYIAYAFLRGKWSVFNNLWSVSLSALAHELGHNWNLNHAGQNGADYGDTSGYMGWGTIRTGFPKSCFNAQKNWWLQWYAGRERALVVPSAARDNDNEGLLSLPWTGDLATFVDYDHTNEHQPVLLQISSQDQTKRIYCQYNRAKKFNADTREHPDEIMLVQETGNIQGNFGLQSWLIGAIPPPPLRAQAQPHGYLFNVSDFANDDRQLHIQVCQQVRSPLADYVRLTIFMDGQTSGCIDPDHPVGAPYPTATPTESQLPSSSPSLSLAPSVSPSSEPTASAEPTAFCEDFEDEIFEYWNEDAVGPSFGDCVWLKLQTSSLISGVCSDPHSQARDVCPDTCGKCIDHCEDDVTTPFLVSASQGEQTCRWLWVRPKWQESICVPDHPAYEICAETCNSCPAVTRGPTISPSLSTAPSSTPSLSSSIEFCEDTTARFKLTSTSANLIDCAWVNRNADFVASKGLCQRDHPTSNAPEMCPDTCGLCYDNCKDDQTQTFDVAGAQRTCLWLSNKPNWVQKLCVKELGSDAFDLCPETCGNTERCPRSPPCEDSPQMFWIPATEHQPQRRRNCVWLQRRTTLEQARYCEPPDDFRDIETAYHTCPETCGKCTDDCEDDPSILFYVNSAQGSKSCEWLSSRPPWQATVCEKGSRAWSYCRESCNSCASY